MKITIIGGTGLIGMQLIKQACADHYFTKINVIVRRSLAFKDPKINELVINFSDLSSVIKETIGDALVCALGTTRKTTPDKKYYREIDLTYTLISAKGALENGHKQIHLISSIGANENSAVFYPALKGEIERLVSQLPFLSTYIYRPSVLLGQRKSFRFFEYLSKGILFLLYPFLIGSLSKYRGISAEKLSKKIIFEIKNNKPGIQIVYSNEIKLNNI
jgi:uncharacterized protein YbjT (DUF2867 family)